jgi:hypothetical protein
MTPSIPLAALKAVTGLVGPKDLTVEHWREYDFGDRVYRIDDPVALYFREGGTTHRVVDSKGIVHCVPFGPSIILRWKNKIEDPVGF